MNKLGVVLLCVSAVIGTAVSQAVLCQKSCILLCETTARLCLNVFPVVNCDVNKAACYKSCPATCSCNNKCTNSCAARNMMCQFVKKTKRDEFLCQTELTLCTSSCPVKCVGQTIFTTLRSAVGHILAGNVNATETDDAETTVQPDES